jgi:hypothetical protein
MKLGGDVQTAVISLCSFPVPSVCNHAKGALSIIMTFSIPECVSAVELIHAALKFATL